MKNNGGNLKDFGNSKKEENDQNENCLKTSENPKFQIEKIHLAQTNERKLSCYNACEYLYVAHKLKIKDNNGLMSKSKKKIKFTLAKTDEIYNQSKFRSFTKFFKSLDKDHIGRIAVNKIGSSS